MMDAGRLEWLRDMLAGRKLGDAESGTMKVAVTMVQDSAEVLQRIREFNGTGWICYTDQVVETKNRDNVTDGMVLSAELVDQGGGTSLHVRHIAGEWLVSRISEEKGESQLIVNEKRLRIGGGLLNYRVAWGQVDGGDAWQPVMFRFTGFGGE